MRSDDIEEGKTYVDGTATTYFRTVEMIVDSPARPGGKVVSWSTSGFIVIDGAKRTHGKCGIKTFAAWARYEVK